MEIGRRAQGSGNSRNCPRHGPYPVGRGCPDCCTERQTRRLYINLPGEQLQQHYSSRAKYHNEQHDICQARIRVLQASGSRQEEIAQLQRHAEAHAQRAWSHDAIGRQFVPGEMYRLTEEDIEVFEGPTQWLTRLLKVPAATASRLVGDQLRPGTLAEFRTPKALCLASDPSQVGIPADKLFNEDAQGFHQKLQEAWILARLGIVRSCDRSSHRQRGGRASPGWHRSLPRQARLGVRGRDGIRARPAARDGLPRRQTAPS